MSPLRRKFASSPLITLTGVRCVMVVLDQGTVSQECTKDFGCTALSLGAGLSSLLDSITGYFTR